MNRAVLAALVSVTFAGAVRAQDPAEDAKKGAALDEARQHVARAKVHYDLGEFKEAADEYIQVYRLRPLPAILFNVAQAYRQGGMYDKARQFYKAYLRESPDAKNKAMIQQAIREMDEMMAKDKRTKEKPPRGVQEPVEPARAATAPLQTAPPAAEQSARAPLRKPPEATKEPQQTARPAAEIARTPPAGVPAGRVGTTAPATSVPPAISTRLPEPVSGKFVSSTQRTWSYVAAGASVALLGGGILSAMKAKSYNDALLAGPHSTATTNDLMSTSSSAGKLSTILFVTGLAAAAGAGALYFVPFSSGASVGGNF